MTGNFKKLIESVQVDIILTDMLYQWANTPTGTTAAVDKSWTPNHELIKKNLQDRHVPDKEGKDANSYFENYFEKFKKLVEEAGFDFNSGYLEATLFVNEYLSLNPILKLETLSRLASATPKEGQIVWLYCKFKDQWLQDSWGSYSDEKKENSIKAFKKFSEILDIMFKSKPNEGEITHVLINLGFVNELEWVTSKTYKESGLYIFSSYLEDIAQNIDKYVNIKGAI